MTKFKTQIKREMTNYKAQMSKKEAVLAFKPLDFVCHLDFVIWI